MKTFVTLVINNARCNSCRSLVYRGILKYHDPSLLSLFLALSMTRFSPSFRPWRLYYPFDFRQIKPRRDSPDLPSEFQNSSPTSLRARARAAFYLSPGSLQSAATNVSRARAARRSKFNQTSKRLPAPVEARPRIAIRGFRTNFRYSKLVPSPARPHPHSFCRPSTQHPALPSSSPSAFSRSYILSFHLARRADRSLRDLRDSGREDRLSGN